MLAKMIDIKTIDGSSSGLLSVFEAPGDLPFEIKRIYYMHHVPAGTKRGMHAHRELKQLIFCPYGEVEIMLDDGRERESVILDNPSQGLYIEPFLWREMIWRKDDSVLIVAASLPYDEEDYVRDYTTFLAIAKANESNK